MRSTTACARRMALDPADYPLSGAGKASDLFPGMRWWATATCRALPPSRCRAWSPAWASRTSGSAGMPWRDLLAPAVALAERGPAARLVLGPADGVGGARSWRGIPMPRRMFLDDGSGRSSAAGPRSPTGDLDQRALAGDAAADRARRAARVLRRRRRAAHWCATCAPRAAAWRRPISPATGRASSTRWRSPYRGGRMYAAPGLTGGPTFAQALRQLEQAFTPGGTGPDAAASYVRIRAGARRRLPHTASSDGRPRVAAGAGLHHALQRRRPARQPVRGDADAAVDLRLARGLALDRRAAEQRHHVVRSGAGQAELARRPASAASATTAR